MAETCKHGMDRRFCSLCRASVSQTGASPRARGSRPPNAWRAPRVAAEPAMVRQGERVAFLFNNCHGREHARLFGPGAFFDLVSTSASETAQAEKLDGRLRVGDDCIVATRANDGRIVFTSYSFGSVADRPNPDDRGMPTRVFFGTAGKVETLSKGDAARDPTYAAFFNVNGHFKRQAVIQR